MDRLAAMAALERRYDGPIPAPLRQNTIAGSPERRLLIVADGQADLFAALTRNQVEAIRRARRGDGISARLSADLTLYRRQWRWWRREARRLRALLATRSAGGAP